MLNIVICWQVCYTSCGGVGHGQQLTRKGPGEVGCALEVDGRALEEAGGLECTQEELVRRIRRRE